MKLEDLVIISLLNDLKEGQDAMSLDLSKVQTEVSEAKTVMEGAAALLDNLATEIRANAGNQDALNALADDLDQNSNALADAVARNTAAEPAEDLPVEEPVIEPTPEPSPEPAPAEDTGEATENADLIAHRRRR